MDFELVAAVAAAGLVAVLRLQQPVTTCRFMQCKAPLHDYNA